MLYFLLPLLTHSSLVPPQTPENINPLVISYLEAEFAKLNSKNKLDLESLHGGKPWVENVKHWNYEAAKKATEVRNFLFVLVILTSSLYIQSGRVQEDARPDARRRFHSGNAHICGKSWCKHPVVAYGQRRRRCTVSDLTSSTAVLDGETNPL